MKQHISRLLCLCILGGLLSVPIYAEPTEALTEEIPLVETGEEAQAEATDEEVVEEPQFVGTETALSVYIREDYEVCTFIVSWENVDQSAVVRLESPDDEIYWSGDLDGVVAQAGQLHLPMEAVESGRWNIYVIGEDLGLIYVNGGTTETSRQATIIHGFSVSQQDGTITLDWDVETDLSTIDLSVYYHQGNGSREYTLYNDYRSDSKGRVTMEAENFITGMYSFVLYVKTDGQTQRLETEMPIYVEQPDPGQALDNVQVGSVDGIGYISWDADGDNGYYVAIYEADTWNLLEQVNLHDTIYEIPSEYGACQVGVMRQNEYRSYSPMELYAYTPCQPEGAVILPETTLTRDRSILWEAVCGENVTAGIYVNGTLLLEDAISGTYSLFLEEGTNEVVAYLKDQNGNVTTTQRQIVGDYTAPELILDQSDYMETSLDYVTISGLVSENSVVSINGVEQSVGSREFSANVSIEDGASVITVAAYDAAGNKTVQSIEVERAASGSQSPWMLFIAPGLLFVVLGIWYGVLNRKPKEEDAA